MGLSDLDRKILWARAGNRCSYRFDNKICNEILIADSKGKDVNIGEECHIVGERPTAARHIPNYPEMDAYSNRILMCRKHHKIIDSHEEIYTIDVLRHMKAEHENAIIAATSVPNRIQTPSPTLVLKMFQLVDRSRSEQEELSFKVSEQANPVSRVFGLSLRNTMPSTVAQDIRIRIQVCWGGGQHLQKAPVFDVPPRSNWKAEPKQLVNEHPAVLTFKDANCASFYDHPEMWTGFKLTLFENWSGFFRLIYNISSREPFTENSGELRITISQN